jgi:hypothetical protein
MACTCSHNLRISGGTGLLGALQKGGDLFGHLHRAVGKAMRQEVQPMREAVRRHVGSELKVVRRSFLHAFRVKVLDQDPTRLPGMWIGSRIPWSGVHESGVTIGGKMLIPLHGRLGKKRFKTYVDELMRGGNAYFIKKGGKVILMAENLKEYDRPLAGFKRRYRKAEGIKRLKRGADIPIAILVRQVTLRKRLNVKGVVRQRIPALERAIQRFL